MRLWIRERERRPNPPQARVDERKAVAVGLVLWIIAAVVALILYETLRASGTTWFLWCALCGIGLGAVGLIYLQVKRR